MIEDLDPAVVVPQLRAGASVTAQYENPEAPGTVVITARAHARSLGNSVTPALWLGPVLLRLPDDRPAPGLIAVLGVVDPPEPSATPVGSNRR